MLRTLNIVIDTGADFSQQFIVHYDSGSVVNLTGYSVSGFLTYSELSPSVISFSVEILNALHGLIKFSLPSGITKDLSLGRAIYRLGWTSPSDGVISIALDDVGSTYTSVPS